MLTQKMNLFIGGKLCFHIHNIQTDKTEYNVLFNIRINYIYQ